MLNQSRSKKFLTFLVLAVFFAAGYSFSDYRWRSKTPIESPSRPMRLDSETVSEQSPPSPTTMPFIAPEVSKSSDKSKAEKYSRLKKLSPEVQISYFGDLLGKPDYINYFDTNTPGYEFLKDEIREYIFADSDYFVQAITDKHDKVMSFAVTSRKEDFNPLLPWGNAVKVVLNKTPFSEWMPNQERPLACYRFTGAHDPFYYFEEAYFGNPGNYLTYLVGINNSAPPYNEIPDLKDGYEFGFFGRIPCEATNEKDRVEMSPNTYIIRGISFIDVYNATKSDPRIFFGPDNILVRTLNE